jgi:hypothetical protein
MDTNLDTSDWRLWVMCVIIVGCLAFWLAAVFLAARSPGSRNVSPDRDQAAADSGIPAEQTRDLPIPRPAWERDTSVPMPAQRAESPDRDARPANRP